MAELSSGVGNHKKPNKLHITLAHSYGTYLGFFLVGVIVDFIFPIRIFSGWSMWVGVGLILWATMLVVWAQRTSSLFRERSKQNPTVETSDFHRGPYRFTRSPTHVGLGLLLLGFGFIMNSIVIVVLTVGPFLLAHFVYLQKMETILEGKYGDVYKLYKEKVKKLL